MRRLAMLLLHSFSASLFLLRSLQKMPLFPLIPKFHSSVHLGSFKTYVGAQKAHIPARYQIGVNLNTATHLAKSEKIVSCDFQWTICFNIPSVYLFIYLFIYLFFVTDTQYDFNFGNRNLIFIFIQFKIHKRERERERERMCIVNLKP